MGPAQVSSSRHPDGVVMPFHVTLRRSPLRLTMVLARLAGLLVATVAATTTAARADGCYTWTRTLSQGASGEDVRQLQIRVAGYPGYGRHLVIDGQYGA